MQPPLNISVLDNDSPPPEFQSQYGSYGDAFIRLLSNASMTLNPPLGPSDLQFKKWDVERSPDYYPEIDEVDALIVVGSQDLLGSTAMDSTPWILKLTDFVRKVLMEHDRVRVIGVNFGHLIIARALGCVIDRLSQWETSITTVSLSDMGKKVYGREELNIMQLHRDHVVTLPVNPFPQLPNAVLDLIGSTDACAIQGLYTPRKVISLQGHPELDVHMIGDLVRSRLQAGSFSKDAAEDAVGRAPWRNDGVYIAATFLKFMLDK
ncbi:hypothetical protein H072_9733 [Dactylellina haptotyla CBS 200.50]|uniref:Glutamine amidotransferase domain-containing protein n=1 Tax=Dactylellina haptotyla (strain CBS 200.50) TaxID=1284197 RepID=S8A1Z5_DACHA|nr:hypothetical protein H072_9733 [Dactylellina haptotyla CBS 200.50]